MLGLGLGVGFRTEWRLLVLIQTRTEALWQAPVLAIIIITIHEGKMETTLSPLQISFAHLYVHSWSIWEFYKRKALFIPIHQAV